MQKEKTRASRRGPSPNTHYVNLDKCIFLFKFHVNEAKTRPKGENYFCGNAAVRVYIAYGVLHLDILQWLCLLLRVSNCSVYICAYPAASHY